MRLSLAATLRRHRVIVAAVSAAVLAAAPVHAQATAQPTKTAAPKTTAAPATPAKAPAATAQAAMAAPTKQPPATKPASSPAAPKQVSTANRVYIDINHATVKELKNIPGIGDAYAAKIIAGRPYANKSQLVSKKIINENLYETIQGMIIAKK